MRIFTVGEEWGPFPCEVKGCTQNIAFSIVLTDEENERLPQNYGPEAVRYIFDNRLGVAKCDDCLKEDQGQ